MARDGDAFLSFLFVLPQWQARGLGRAVISECLHGAGQTARLATCAEANQPVSTGLYASLGLAPRVPIYLLRGALEGHALPRLPADVRARSVAADEVAPLDDQLLGYRRPQDHAFWSRAAAAAGCSRLPGGGCSATGTLTPAVASGRSPPWSQVTCRPCSVTSCGPCPCWKAGKW